jgi:hypothetical protein
MRIALRGGLMTHIKTLLTGSVVAAVVLALPHPAPAQETKAAGVVTTLQGTATVTRVAAAQTPEQVLPLKFREDVFARDRVRTDDQSLVRILLGGRAVVTVRERSELTITETPDVQTIEIKTGKIALAVAKEKMKPNERIDVKTPNAVAGVRGTVLITEVTQQAGQPPRTDFTLITGIVDVLVRDSTGRSIGSPVMLNALQTLGISGFTPPSGPRNITPAQAQTIANGYKANLKEPPANANQQVKDRQVEQAGNSAAIAGTGGVDTLKTFVARANNPGPPTRTVTGDDTRNGGGHDPAAITPPPPPPPTCNCLREGGTAALTTARPRR